MADKRHSYHSAQRLQQQEGQQEELASVANAVKLAISDKRSACLNGFGKCGGNGIHLLPSTNKVYRNVKRIEFSRRMQMMDRPLVIVSFEGVVGSFHRDRIWSDKNPKLVTRGGAAVGLRLFCTYFQVVIFVQTASKKTAARVRDWLKAKAVFPDAIYSRKSDDEHADQDYAQIYNDFNIVSSKGVAKSTIVISSLDVDATTIKDNKELEAVVTGAEHGQLVRGLPYTVNCQSGPACSDSPVSPAESTEPKSVMALPVTLLFPSVLNEAADDVSMCSIFKIVLSIAFLSLKDYADNFKRSDLRGLREADVKLHRQFLGLDLSNVCQRSSSLDALFRCDKCDEDTSTTILSDSETKKISVHNLKVAESSSNSFELNHTAKVASSDEETSDHDSCSSANNCQHNKLMGQSKKLQPSALRPRTLNEASLTKVNWLLGFEEASSKHLFDLVCLRTFKVHEQVIKRSKNYVKRYLQKFKRDEKLQEMLNVEMSEEAYLKSKSIQITNMIGSVLKYSGAIGNPLQSMAARNIRHFENVRKQLLDPISARA
mmetsp:Transcript_33094/g.38004  ORF Transcript_33094/g.38004 Transcript_33094/m.38004 type:complete len:544 (-) Transcript_33094:23-1654(-)